MAVTAAECAYRPESSWVYAFILTCNNTLAVWYKHSFHIKKKKARAWSYPGVCVNYTSSNAQMYYVAKASPSAGHYARGLLYRLPYTIIKPPCPASGCNVTTACCPSNPLPTTLHLTFTSYPSNPSLALTYSGGSWSGSQFMVAASTGLYKFQVSCSGTTVNNYLCQVTGPTGDINAAAIVFGQNHCSPFQVKYIDAIEGAGNFTLTT